MESLIESSVSLGENVTVAPFCVIKGNTVIGDNSVIESFSYLENAVIGKGTTVKASRITDSQVGDNTTVGPHAHLRNGTKVGNNCRIGNYVEFKNVTFGDKSKAAHLAYVGDATVGNNVNIGCGVVFVNYDGRNKHKTTVGDNCFIGSNSNLIAPLMIDDDCFIACGTTVTDSLQKGDFAIGRSRMSVKQNRSYRYLKTSKGG